MFLQAELEGMHSQAGAWEQEKKGIPWLHELPLIGPLFGNTEKKKRKTELVVLITPRVVKSRLDAELVTDEFQRKLSGIYEESIEINQP